ncbi:relaxase/mobilization nuclease domain-containing protein [uncultured Lacticaseibacillus sp.]|uniref:relaxase/mobilization nuclease domain-containing protein n=1 Tax=uncultured Lacticaseibacillus sp. TaxID=2775882 RepID=UPI002597E1CE|nr:relaxase/mobilization nuclease domain-containing protein [uncultured Lacticaseibacillus sp.]
MTILKTQPVKKSRSRLVYVFSTAAHDDSGQRVLAAGGINLKLQHNDSPIQNPAMLEKQFQLGSIHARNAHRNHEAQSTIISFAPSEFDGSDLATQSKQALALVKGFIAETIPNGQTAIAIQADGAGTGKIGSGHRVHVHVITNRIDPKTGKALRNGFSVFKMRHQLDNYMEDHFEEVTGRKWVNPNAKPAPAARADVPSTIPWRESLKQSIRDAAAKSETLAQLQKLLSTVGITMKPRGSHLSYTDADKHKARDFYQRKDKKTGAVISTRGLGRDFTPDGLLKMMSQHKQKEVDVNATIENSEQRLAEQQRSKRLAEQQRQEQLQQQQRRQRQQQLDESDAATEPQRVAPTPRPNRTSSRSEPDGLER